MNVKRYDDEAWCKKRTLNKPFKVIHRIGGYFGRMSRIKRAFLTPFPDSMIKMIEGYQPATSGMTLRMRKYERRNTDQA